MVDPVTAVRNRATCPPYVLGSADRARQRRSGAGMTWNAQRARAVSHAVRCTTQRCVSTGRAPWRTGSPGLLVLASAGCAGSSPHPSASRMRIDGLGARQFTADDIARVQFLRRAQELGFGLGELANLLALSRRARSADATSPPRAQPSSPSSTGESPTSAWMHRAIAGLLAVPCIDPAAPCPTSPRSPPCTAAVRPRH
jgi:hypothetical protein